MSTPDAEPAAWLLTVDVPGPDAESQAGLLADQLWGAGAQAIEERPLAPTGIALIAGFDSRAAGDLARRAVAPAAARLDPAPPADEWHDVWLDHLGPLRIGRFVVHPPWLTPPQGAGQPITIDPGRTFGSGQHASTALAIEALEATVRSGDRVFDVGTGSGILAIASVLLGGADVLAIDLDPTAVDQTQRNAEANDVEDRVRTTGDDLAHVAGSFDVVVANITCHSMLPLIDDLRARTDRALVVSGLLFTQRELIIEAVGHEPQMTLPREGWCSLVFSLTD